jgi:hypothetical protein
MVDQLNDAVGAIIGSMVLGGMIVGGILKYLEYSSNKKLKAPLKGNIINATTYNIDLYVTLNKINNRFGDKIIKTITAETTNGGGIPKTGYPTYIKMLLENTGPGIDAVIKYWHNPQLCTQEYTKMLLEVIKNGVFMWDTKSIEDGEIKDLLKGQGVKQSWVWALGLTRNPEDTEKDSFMLLVVDFNIEFTPDPIDKLFMRNIVNELQTILSLEPSFSPYNRNIKI